MPGIPPTLPVLERRDEIRDLIARFQVVVLCGATGSGKTTQLPQICLELGLPGLIGHTQPRRLAARAVAARIAEERGEALGGLVGVKVRFHDQTSPRTRIKVLTDGMLLAELAGDPDLRAYGVIIIDEAHERSLNIDFLLGYLRGLTDRRPDLKIIITSATIDPASFSRHFGGQARAPILEVSGRLYPVDIRYRPLRDASAGPTPESIADAIEELPGGRGDILVFLPGEREIRQAADAVSRRRLGLEVLPLFSRLGNQEQDRIFHPGPSRRVVLATNVAETSLTVPGIRYVIDTGLARLARYDPARKVQGLPVEPISRASADQRAGRCGRTEAGVCIRLYSEESYRSRPAFTEPEIRRSSLAGVILRMKSLGLDGVERFPFLDPPEQTAIRDGHETLFELGACASCDPDSPLTDTGARMGRVPVDPRVARMLLAGASLGVLEATIVLASVLSIQDPRERPTARQEEADRSQSVFRNDRSDFLTLIAIWDQYSHADATCSRGELLAWCREHFLSPARMREWADMINQLRRTCEDLGLEDRGVQTEGDVHKALLTGLISNVACREGEAGSFEYRGVRGNKVQIFPGSVLFKRGPKWIMAAELAHTTRLYARTVAQIEPAWIEELAGHMFRRQYSDAHFDADAGEACAWERVTMSGIVVVPRRRIPLAGLDPAAARKILIRDGLVGGELTLELPVLSEIREVMRRASAAEARLRRRDVLTAESELEGWFEGRLPATISTGAAIADWCRAEPGASAARLRLPLADVVRPEARRGLDAEQFPEHLEVDQPTGPLPIEYRWVPGQDEDGATVTATLQDLPELSSARLQWLIPGWLEELTLALLKALPKAERARVESHSPLADTARAAAQLMSFGRGELPAALSESLSVLTSVNIAADSWNFKSLPAHLRLRVRVVDTAGKELGAGRDLSELLSRFGARISRARSQRERAAFEQAGLRDWTFGSLVTSVETEAGTRHPALVDEGDSVRLTLRAGRDEASALTSRGVRRLLAIACEDDLIHYVHAIPSWPELVRQYAQLGSEAQLKNEVAALAADRVFLDSQSMPADEATFRGRVDAHRGRLPVAVREVGELLARVLAARARVAQRLSGGTPRLWAASVADIREHAAYLMPRGFLGALTWERFRSYPLYAEAMRERLFALREEGIRAETEALRAFTPHWKRFTAWVSSAMSAERQQIEAPSEARGPRGAAPLPQARRAAPSVNLEAGEWAMQPGRLPAEVLRYRWLLEECRLAVFAAGGQASWPERERGLQAQWLRTQLPPAVRNE